MWVAVGVFESAEPCVIRFRGGSESPYFVRHARASGVVVACPRPIVSKIIPRATQPRP